MAGVKDYEPSTYGDRMADVYDELFLPAEPGLDAEFAAATGFLARLARSGRALELGVGTGRMALALVAQGIGVTGIDASPRMIDKLRQRPGGADLPVLLGDFAEMPDSGEYQLIYVVFNTLFLLPSQEKQLACLQNVAARLAPDGVFVVEVFVPNGAQVERQDTVQVHRVELDGALVSLSRHDPVTQQVNIQHVAVGAQGVQLYPVMLRYAWPSELDLMARLAGLRLAGRWGGWSGEPFTARSRRHVSAYVHAGREDLAQLWSAGGPS
jgi:SAM-dependent methyltransferase